jgi:hypothetical protein
MSKYFKEIENNMNVVFLAKLDEARELAEIPFKINSAYRTKEHNKKIAEKKKEYLRTKTERRGQFQKLGGFPGNLLLAMFKKAGLPTPQIMP